MSSGRPGELARALSRGRLLLLPPVAAGLLLTAVDSMLTLRALPGAAGAPGFLWLLPVLALVGPVLEVPLALLVPRLGARRFVAGAMLVAGVAAAASALAGAPAVFILCRVLGFAAHTVLVPALVFVVAGWAPAGARTGMLAWLAAVLALGQVLAAMLWSTAAIAVSGPVAFGGLAAAWLLAGGWAWWALPRPDGGWLAAEAAEALQRSRRMERRDRLRPGRRDLRLALLAGVALCLGLSGAAAGQWVGVLFRELPQRLTFDLVLAGVAGAGALVWGFALDRSGRVAGGLTLACGLAAMGFAASVTNGPGWQKMAGLAAHGAGLAAAAAMLWSLAGRLAQEAEADAASARGVVGFAVIDAAGRAGLLAGPVALVWLARAADSLPTALLAFVAVLLIAVAAAAALRLVSSWE